MGQKLVKKRTAKVKFNLKDQHQLSHSFFIDFDIFLTNEKSESKKSLLASYTTRTGLGHLALKNKRSYKCKKKLRKMLMINDDMSAFCFDPESIVKIILSVLRTCFVISETNSLYIFFEKNSDSFAFRGKITSFFSC